MKRNIEPIESDIVRLRLLEETDLETTRHWRNQEHIRKWFFNNSVISEAQQIQWFNSYKELDNDFVFIIEEKKTLKCPIGQISLYHIDWEQKTAEYGRLLIGDVKAKGLGLAHEATKLLLDFAIKSLKLQAIYLEVFIENQSALKVYKDCGFAITETQNNIVRMAYNSLN